MVLCLESDSLLYSKGGQHPLKKDPEEILVIPVGEKAIAKFNLVNIKFCLVKHNSLF